jgi:hypothetical protein
MSIIERNVIKYSQNPSSTLHVKYDRSTQLPFENTYKYLCSRGFSKIKESQMLTVYYEGITAEIKTSARIKDFCKNNIVPISTEYYSIKDLATETNDEYLFKTKLFTKTYLQKDGPVRHMIQKWDRISKEYKIINTIILSSPDIKGLDVHFIITKRDRDGHKFSESSVFNSKEIYEIRLVPNLFSDSLISNIRAISKCIMIGIQNSNFPLKQSTMQQIGKEYSDTYGSKLAFIGPSSFTLQQSNLIDNEDDVDNTSPYVLNNFCVTDKADGERRILFIASDGKLYLISVKLDVQYTGAYVTDTNLHGTVIDGEYITHGKDGTYINTYAAFDVYIINIPVNGTYKKKDVRPLEFASGRYKILKKGIQSINQSIVLEKDTMFTVDVKKFYFNTAKKNLYLNCKSLFSSMKSKAYNTDGIILTHELFGVGMTDTDTKIKNVKFPWTHSFKWKPPELNTIDFKVVVINEPSTLLKNPVTNSLEPYKQVHLYVGMSRGKYTHIQNMLLTKKQTASSTDNIGIFTPTKEIDAEAHICYLPYTTDVDGFQKIFTIDGDVIEHKDIVEFRYELTADKGMRWIPLKIRHDKKYPNNFETANSNWYSIHHPVTPDMLMNPSALERTGVLDQVSSTVNDQVYFGAIDKSTIKTTKLKSFHHSIKYYIYESVFKKSNVKDLRVIDYSIGRGADMKKYINSGVKYLLGIDLASSNIHSTTDGPAKRYLDEVSNTTKKTLYMFIEGDTSKPILTGEFSTDTVSNNIIDIYFGKKDIRVYDKLNENNMYGKCRDGFDVGSVQFTLHYMFENLQTLHGFAKNCCDTIKHNGYLVGTCYDGKRVFELLKDEKSSRELRIDNTVIWGIKKEYDKDTLLDDESCLGLRIAVYQETLGHSIQEYLVNFDYFKQIMSLYGFTSEFDINDVTGKPMNAINTFESLYNPKKPLHENEQKISFLNNYFIFKKTEKVNSDKVYNKAIKQSQSQGLASSNAISIGKHDIKL